MSTWIFQGNPTKFNVDDFLLENENIWWSIRQVHLAEHINLGDEVFIWRSDGGNKGSGGIVAKTKVITLPQDYTNDSSAEYWYEDVSGDTYLAVELEVLEVEIEKLLKRTVLLQDSVLKELPILKMRNNTNYLLEEEIGVRLKTTWTELISEKENNDVIVKQLKSKFHQAMINITEQTKKFGYNPTRFKKMLLADGGYIVAKKLLSSKTVSDGFSVLWENNALDLSVEAVVLQKQFRPLFTVEEIAIAKNRLSEFGYEIVDTNGDKGQNHTNSYHNEEFTDWQVELVETLKVLGGSGTLEDIYLTIQERNQIDLLAYVDWKSQIRKQIYLHSSDCDIFRGNPGDESDLFYSIEGKGKGYWGLRNFTPTNNNVSLTEDELSFEEGKRKLRTHLVRERNPKIIKLAKERFKEKHGRLFCEVCDFDFFEKYGELGEDFIEGHHTIPVSDLEEGQSTKVDDIALVCSNCHKMLHRRRPWLNKSELKKIIEIE